jgi:hypothetical protein
MSYGPRHGTRLGQSEVPLGAPQTSRQSSPNNSPSPTFSNNERLDTLTEDERKVALERLNSFITEYRERKIPKFKALSGILGLLEGDHTLSSSEKEQAVELYIEELNSIRQESDSGNFRSRSRRSHDPEEIEKSIHELLDEVSNRAKSLAKSSDEEFDIAEEPPNKRKRITESEMPWYRPGQQLDSLRSASSRDTCKYLRIFNQDIPGCKFWIKLADGAPPGIPSPQWERIFRGEPVELDHFLSSLHRTSINEEGETRIGNAKITLGVSDAKRRVSTASEWSAAWHSAARAIAFVFPHRAEELRAYGDYIEGEFAAKFNTSHPKVILFDIAVRNLVQGGQSILLTDQQHFFRLYSAIIMPDGIESYSGKSANRRSNLTRVNGSKSDICNRFNSTNGCKFSDSDCKYRHACKNCKKSGHGKEQCTN